MTNAAQLFLICLAGYGQSPMTKGSSLGVTDALDRLAYQLEAMSFRFDSRPFDARQYEDRSVLRSYLEADDRVKEGVNIPMAVVCLEERLHRHTAKDLALFAVDLSQLIRQCSPRSLRQYLRTKGKVALSPAPAGLYEMLVGLELFSGQQFSYRQLQNARNALEQLQQEHPVGLRRHLAALDLADGDPRLKTILVPLANHDGWLQQAIELLSGFRDEASAQRLTVAWPWLRSAFVSHLNRGAWNGYEVASGLISLIQQPQPPAGAGAFLSAILEHLICGEEEWSNLKLAAKALLGEKQELGGDTLYQAIRDLLKADDPFALLASHLPSLKIGQVRALIKATSGLSGTVGWIGFDRFLAPLLEQSEPEWLNLFQALRRDASLRNRLLVGCYLFPHLPRLTILHLMRGEGRGR